MVPLLATAINEEHYLLDDHPFLAVAVGVLILTAIIGLICFLFWLFAKVVSKIQDRNDIRKRGELNKMTNAEKQTCYCKNCGKEIDADSRFCQYCGHKILDQESHEEKGVETRESAPVQESKGNRLSPGEIFLIVFIGIMVLALIIFGISTKITENNPTRSATNYDISIQTEPSLFTYNITLTPYRDISELQITFEFYGDDNKLIATKRKDVGNVKKDTKYDISYSISEFSLSSLTKISKFKWTVTGGTTNKNS